MAAGWARALSVALALLIAYCAVVVIPPELEKLWPDTPAAVLNGGVVVTTIILEAIVYALVSWKAVLLVRWADGASDARDLHVHELVARLPEATRTAENTYWLTVHRKKNFGLGALALRLAAKQGLDLHVEGLHTSLMMQVEARGVDLSEETFPQRRGCYAIVPLRAPVPSTTGEWGSVRIRFAGRVERPNRTTDLQTTRVGHTRLARLCGILIRVDAKVVSIQERWS